jgi:hypothetical protein
MRKRLATSLISLVFGFAAVALLFATAASANTIGDLKAGSGNGTVTLTLSSIGFNADSTAIPAGPPWNAEVANTTALTFAGCPSGVLNSPGCLASGEGIEFANNIPIVLGAGLAANNPFIQFAAHPTIIYTITGLGPGAANTNCAGLAVGQSCSIFAGSPLILTDTPTGTTLSFAANGTVTDGAGLSNWIGGFAEPITGLTPFQIQSFFCTGPGGTCTPADFSSGRSITKPWAGDFLAAAAVGAPEPGSLVLFGSGIMLLAGILRKKLHS